MKDEHNYSLTIQWPFAPGDATNSYTSYQRKHEITGEGKTIGIPMSSDPHFRGDAENYNPEELLLGSLSSCHMLWYLHLCSTNGVVVTSYRDEPIGLMITQKNGSGRFDSVTLKPVVEVATKEMIEKAITLHQQAHEMCFISNSVNFKVNHEPKIEVSPSGA